MRRLTRQRTLPGDGEDDPVVDAATSRECAGTLAAARHVGGEQLWYGCRRGCGKGVHAVSIVAMGWEYEYVGDDSTSRELLA
jgi:hypothetical protein